MQLIPFEYPSAGLEILTKVSEVFITSPDFKKVGAGGMLAKILTTKTHNISITCAFNNALYFIDGLVVLSPQLMKALILRAGHKIDVLTHPDDTEKCILKFTKKNEPDDPHIEIYTREMAETAGLLTKKNWKVSPARMLYYRCMAGGARYKFSDIMLGFYFAGELMDTNKDEHIMPDEEIISPKFQSTIIMPEEDVVFQAKEGVSKIKTFKEFSQKFPEEKEEDVIRFLQAYGKHYTKTEQQVLDDHNDPEKFIKTFRTFQKKHGLSSKREENENNASVNVVDACSVFASGQ